MFGISGIFQVWQAQDSTGPGPLLEFHADLFDYTSSP